MANTVYFIVHLEKERTTLGDQVRSFHEPLASVLVLRLLVNGISPQIRKLHVIHGQLTRLIGPFEPADDNELIKDDEHCGVIDPSHFTDGDCLHYVWRRQGCGGQLTSIWTQEFDIKDGQKKIGEPHMLIEAPGLGLHNIREAPYIIKSEDTYFLFYSSGYFNDDTYTVSWATRKGDLKGKFDEQGALLKTGSEESAGKKFLSPGGMTLIPVKGKQDQWHMAFHARDPPHGRPLYTATVQIKNGKPVIL